MLVYHLGNTKYAHSLTGEGAKLHGGRWNMLSIPCIYTSESIALSVLEYAANVRLEEMPQNLSITVYELPLKSWKEVNASSLPKNWRSVPVPEETKVFGSALLRENNLALKVPSAIIPSEFNFILNPLANNFNLVKIVSINPFTMDRRIKK